MPHRRTHALAFTVAAALAALSVLAPARVERVDAASCNGASHSAPTLSSGRASPGSGSPTTRITFSVRYADALGCAPSSVEVTIAGVGRYRMNGSGTAYASGVTFRYTRKLPAGRWSYRFTASSGSGAGQRSATLTTVSPSRVVIKRPTSTAPKPTPRPTAPPPSGTKPKPPKATPRPVTAPGVTGSPSTQPGGQAPAASDAPSAVPAQAGSGYPGGGPDDRGDATRGGGHRDPAGISGVGGLGLGLDPAVLVPVATWSLTTAFGVLVFGLGLLPVRRRRDPAHVRRSWLGRAGSVAAAIEPGPMSPPEPTRSTGTPDGSTTRTQGAAGSVDEAAPGVFTTTVREPLRFQAPPRPGVERRTIAYRFIQVVDQPDATASSEICRLDRGDEIEIIGEHEGYLQIKTPTGIEGWVQRMVIVG